MLNNALFALLIAIPLAPFSKISANQEIPVDPTIDVLVLHTPSVESAYIEFPDCNGNGIDDRVEIARDPSLDKNNNGVLDECEHPFPGSNLF